VTKGRLEAFSDGVIAILITIMVLELRPPEGQAISDLHHVAPKLGAYLLSFVLIGIYWVNHHHLFVLVQRIDGRALWANLTLLFCLSLVSFATAWWGEHPWATGPAFWYAVVQLLCALAYTLLVQALLRLHPPPSQLSEAVRTDWKGKLSGIAYLAAALAALVAPWLAIAIIVAVAIAWLVPDRRVARVVEGG